MPLSLTSLASCSDTSRQVEGKYEDASSSITCIIHFPLSLTDCSGRDRKSVLVKLREDTSISLLMSHYNLLSAVVDIDKV